MVIISSEKPNKKHQISGVWYSYLKCLIIEMTPFWGNLKKRRRKSPITLRGESINEMQLSWFEVSRWWVHLSFYLCEMVIVSTEKLIKKHQISGVRCSTFKCLIIEMTPFWGNLKKRRRKSPIILRGESMNVEMQLSWFGGVLTTMIRNKKDTINFRKKPEKNSSLLCSKSFFSWYWDLLGSL